MKLHNNLLLLKMRTLGNMIKLKLIKWIIPSKYLTILETSL